MGDQKLAAQLGELEMLDITGKWRFWQSGLSQCNSDFAKRLFLNVDAGIGTVKWLLWAQCSVVSRFTCKKRVFTECYGYSSIKTAF